MGIWDKIKSAKNYITGGGVDLHLDIIDVVYINKPFKVALNILVKEQDVEADRIYIVINNVEKVNVDVRTYNSSGSSVSKNFQKSHNHFQQEIDLELDVMLEANESYNYEAEIYLPAEAIPSFKGKYTELYWSLRAYIEKSGNNPNSDEIYFDPIVEMI